jgi:hypothetical protein
LAGTPAQAGNYAFGITSTNASGVMTTQNFALSVPAPQIVTDTPVMPAWGLFALASALFSTALFLHPRRLSLT